MAASDRSLPAGVSMRALAETDLEAAAALSTEAGWNQVGADWRLFLQFGSAICLTRNDQLIATAAILPYRPRFAWIGMVLVTAAERRQGLARWLLRYCIEQITGQGLVPALDATPAGRAVYSGLGFQDTWAMRRWVGSASRFAPVSRNGITVRELQARDWPQLVALDAAIFGAERGALLRSLAHRLPEAAFVAVRNGRMAGFSLGRDGREMTQLGPLAAADHEAAITLLAPALSAVSGPVAIDVPDRHAALSAWLGNHGLSAERALTRMVYRRTRCFDDTARMFAVAGPELG